MGILFRYVFREIAFSSLIGGILFTFVLFIRSVGPVMELLVRTGVEPSEVGYLFLLTLPQSLPYTIPMGVLVGVLIGLGRLSADGEIVAMRAAGVPSRRCVAPVAVFCILGVAVGLAVTLEVSPWAARERVRIGESLKISQATAAIQPRVFHENFPDKVLYVRDVDQGPVIHWKGLFLADMRAPEKRGSVSGLNAAVDGPRITIAEEAVVIPQPEQNRLQVHLPRASTFEQSYDPTQYQAYQYEMGDQVIETEPNSFDSRTKPYDEMTVAELRRETREGERTVDASIVYHQRFALPLACLVLPMVGLPLAISAQRAGKSIGVLLSVVLAFAYWMALLGGTALAEEGVAPPAAGVWLANAVFALIGLRMLSQLDSPDRRDLLAAAATRIRGWFKRLQTFSDTAQLPVFRTDRRRRERRMFEPGSWLESIVSIMDRYLLQQFLFYFGVMLGAFVSIWIVFSFFELLSDMLSRGKLALFPAYVYYLIPFLLYETAPLAVLVATLVCFGLMTKNQELTAFRASGVSLYRLSAPVLLAAISVGGALFALDNYYLPETNRRQDAIRDEIKGRPVRTFLRADRQWTFGQRDRIFYHRFFDYSEGAIGGINVYDFTLEPFALARHISAERAVWDPNRAAWIFENGWVRRLEGSRVVGFEQFEQKAFEDIVETPEYFHKEEKQHQQMNWRELRAYIGDLTQAGFDTVRLQVLWHRKFSFPMFSLAMALLAIPFAVFTGSRGALAPVAFSLGLAIGFFALSALFEQLGQAGQLSPSVAAWAPGMIYAFSGTYLFLKVRT